MPYYKVSNNTQIFDFDNDHWKDDDGTAVGEIIGYDPSTDVFLIRGFEKPTPPSGLYLHPNCALTVPDCYSTILRQMSLSSPLQTRTQGLALGTKFPGHPNHCLLLNTNPVTAVAKETSGKGRGLIE